MHRARSGRSVTDGLARGIAKNATPSTFELTPVRPLPIGVDLLVTPQLAEGDQIVAVPTLVRRLPPPIKRIIGNLSDTERVLVGLDIRPKG